MKRTLNWTGRQSIPLEKILIRVVDAKEGGPQSFTAELSGLGDLGLAADARIYVEPYVNTSSMRFDFGTIAKPLPPGDTLMTEIDAGSLPLFRVRVVDKTAEVGKILAAADGVRPSNEVNEDERKSLLPVAYRDLGEGVWELDLQPGARPLLVLNNRIPELSDRIRNDNLFQGAVIPHAVQRILEKLFLDDEYRTDDEWAKDWYEFASAVRGSAGIDEDDDEAEKQAAIDDVVRKLIAQTRWMSRHRQLVEINAGGAVNE